MHPEYRNISQRRERSLSMDCRYKDETMHMTLGEINKRDKDNFKLLSKDLRSYFFHKPAEAAKFMGERLRRCLKALGIEINPKVLAGARRVLGLYDGFGAIADDIDGQLRLKGVRIERRTYKSREDILRSGLYIYYMNEIAYFISDPLLVTVKGRRRIMVRTNAKDDVRLLVRSL